MNDGAPLVRAGNAVATDGPPLIELSNVRKTYYLSLIHI